MTGKQTTAVWTVTPRGARLADKIAREIGNMQIYAGRAVTDPPEGAMAFERLADAVARDFHKYSAHVFIMATGIAVRMIAPYIDSKLKDPAVVVADDSGGFVISLLSGHTGGANEMTARIARSIGATPVITTATDNAGAPAMDVLAGRYGLEIENPDAVKAVSMAFLTGGRVWRHDPYGILDDLLSEWTLPAHPENSRNKPGIFIDHEVVSMPPDVLVLRPGSLVVGMGCNSGTTIDELMEVVCTVFFRHRLSLDAIRHFATITDKLTEPGLVAMADHFGRKLEGYERNRLASITDVPNPSAMVEKHMGVKSVCEAAAIIGASNGRIIVPKNKSGNVTIAVAAVPSMS